MTCVLAGLSCFLNITLLRVMKLSTLPTFCMCIVVLVNREEKIFFPLLLCEVVYIGRLAYWVSSPCEIYAAGNQALELLVPYDIMICTSCLHAPPSHTPSYICCLHLLHILPPTHAACTSFTYSLLHMLPAPPSHTPSYTCCLHLLHILPPTHAAWMWNQALELLVPYDIMICTSCLCAPHSHTPSYTCCLDVEPGPRTPGAL